MTTSYDRNEASICFSVLIQGVCYLYTARTATADINLCLNETDAQQAKPYRTLYPI